VEVKLFRADNGRAAKPDEALIRFS